MFEIINKQIIAEDIKKIDIYAPNIAKKIHPGQFVSVCPEEGEERIPLSVVEWDAQKGCISLILHEVGHTTQKLSSLPINESVFSILGPLGTPIVIEKLGTVLCIATGIGAAQMFPICRALKDAGNKVVGIMGAKTKASIMLEPQMRLACNKINITTEDGSYEIKGLATGVLESFIRQSNIAHVYAIGSVDMMQRACLMTKERGIPTSVLLNPVMVDCMGMCGSCRVRVGGEVVLACIDGPSFDGHQVDFLDYRIRVKAFEEKEQWDSHKFLPKQKKSASRILTKFLLGIPKD